MTDDVIHSTQYYLKYILNRAILVNLQCRPLKLRLRAVSLFLKNPWERTQTSKRASVTVSVT